MIYATSLGISPAVAFDDVGEWTTLPVIDANGVGRNDTANTVIRDLKRSLNIILGEPRFALTGTPNWPETQTLGNDVIAAIHEIVSRLPAVAQRDAQAFGISSRAANVPTLAKPENLAEVYNYFATMAEGFRAGTLTPRPSITTVLVKPNTVAIGVGLVLAFIGVGTVFYLLQRK